MTKTTYVDPPSGWKYGFPKVVPQEILDTVEDGSLPKWLVENGYPLEELCGCVRMWHKEDVDGKT